MFVLPINSGELVALEYHLCLDQLISYGHILYSDTI